MKKFLVYETYMFGKNYYNEAMQIVPDYQITGEFPTVKETTMKTLLERHPNLQVKLIEG